MDDQTTGSSPERAVWLECPSCEGSEGWMGDGVWIDCPQCEGTGGWSE